MIDHDIKCIFIHIPRTAGSSISTALTQRKTDGERFERATRDKKLPKKIHYSIFQAKKIFGADVWEEYLTFAFVRNPWDRLVSQYQWRLAKGEKDVAHRNFKEWVTWRWEGWLNWLKNPRKVIRGVPQLGHRDRAVVLSKAFDEIYDSKEKKILVDFVGRYENLRGDLETLCGKLGVSKDIVLPHKHNAKDRPHYTEFYDDETIEIVRKFYKNDIEVLGYKYGED
jgi:chondroitin 4-sulfotransferase 11